MLDEKTWLAVSALIHLDGVLSGRGQDFVQASQVLPHSLSHVFIALCTGAQSCWNRKGPSPNGFHKVGSRKLFKISWYAEA